jgi:hypothetical protein
VGSDTTSLWIVGWVLVLLVVGLVVALLPRVFARPHGPQLHVPHRWPGDDHGD